jgi:hypothetical protein
MLHFNLRLCILQLEIQRSNTSLPVSDTNLRQFTFDCVERLSRLTTLVEVSDELRRAGGAFGSGTFCMSGLSDPEERLDPYVVLSGRHEAPSGPGDDDAAKVMNEATEFGLADGPVVPTDTAQGFQATVTFGQTRWCSAATSVQVST